MKLKDLKYGDKFKSLNNKDLVCTKLNEKFVGARKLIACKTSTIGVINLPLELEVVKL